MGPFVTPFWPHSPERNSMSINGLNPLAYIGVDSPNPAAQVIKRNTDPTPNDSLNFNIGDIWINQNTNTPNTASIFILTSLAENVATWTEIGADQNILHVLGGTNINVVNAMGDATVNLNPSVVLAGSLTATTNITSTTGSVNAATGVSTTTGDISTLSGNFSAFNTAVSQAASVLTFAKRRGVGPVASGDGLGGIGFGGFDGAINQASSLIISEATGTIGAGRVPSKMKFYTTPDAVSAPVERVLITENGNVAIRTGILDVENGGAFLNDNTVAADGAILEFVKTRNEGIITSGDDLGTISFSANDGVSDFIASAFIDVVSTGVIGPNQVPSKMGFWTTPAAGGGPVERVVIDEIGTLAVAATTSPGSSIIAQGPILSISAVTGEMLRATGDTGNSGVGFTNFTNGTVANVPGGGALTIDSQSAGAGTQAGFIKIYVGAQTAYIPYFTNIAP